MESEHKVPIKEQTRQDVLRYLDACISCHACMDACPVDKRDFAIKQLNEATRQGVNIPRVIKDFAWRCMQCGRCVPVCPVKIRRDVMVRYLKHHMREEKPLSYRRYLLIRGPKLSVLPRFIQHLYISTKRRAHRDLASLMERRPTKPAEVLFYPGCYLYSAETVRHTIRLLDYLGCSYAVLGGMSTCCGMPHLLQGEFDRADECMRHLQRDIARVQPKIILTACAECHDALTKIKSTYDERYEVVSVVEYLSRNQDKFPRRKITGNILVHDSCRFSSTTPAGQAARQAAATFGTLVATTPQHLSCCSHWNHSQDKANMHRRRTYLKEASAIASHLVCPCLTCYEEFKKHKIDMNVMDVIQLYIEALNTQTGQEQP